MKLYYHPASTTSRIVMMYAAESGLDLQLQLVDLFTGEHCKPAYAQINPSCMVPVLEDGDFRLTECSTILKYLAVQSDSPAYPQDLRPRARVNEMMDWFNTNLYRDFAYGLVYPQTFPTHKRPSEEAQAATLAWGKEKSQIWFRILDQHLIGPSKPYVCGERITLADYLGGEMVAVGSLVGCEFVDYPNVRRWLGNMKALKSWKPVHETIDGFAASLKGTPFVAI